VSVSESDPPQLGLRFSLLAGDFCICKMPSNTELPAWCSVAAALVSITRTTEELSIVSPQAMVPAGVQAEGGWACLKLDGPFPFQQTGVLASFLDPLAKNAIPVFAVSTYDTDYVLVKQETLATTLQALKAAGHQLLAR